MAVILHGWNLKGCVYGLLFTASLRELILNKFRIYSVSHIRWRKPYQLLDWINNISSPCVTAGIRTYNIRHSMTIPMGK